MVSTTPRNVRKFRDLLQEEQEPFILDVHLLERSHPKKNMNSFTKCCPADNYSADSALKGSSASHLGGVKNKGKGISRCSNLVKTVYNKFVLINIVNPRVKSPQKKDGQSGSSTNRNKQDVAESDRFSSVSSTTVSNSCSQRSNTEESWKDSILSAPDSLETQSSSREHEIIRAEVKPWKFMQDDHNKQLSPVSVLEEISSHEDSSPRNTTKEDYLARQEGHPSISGVLGSKELVNEYMLSASLMELLSQSSTREKASHDNVQGLQEHFNSIRIMQQTKQLQLDCVREVLEAHRRKRMKQQLFICKEFLGCEEIGKLICEKLIAWDGQNVDETQLNCVFDSTVKWNDFEIEKKETAFDIGDGICEDIINEIVKDLSTLF